jgi:hypothetical protein
MYRKYIFIIISLQKNYLSRDTIPLSRTRKFNCIVMCVRIPPSWFVRPRSDRQETGSASQNVCLTGSPVPTADGASERWDGDENKSHALPGVGASGPRRNFRRFDLVGADEGDDDDVPLLPRVHCVVRSLRSLLPMSREGRPPAR